MTDHSLPGYVMSTQYNIALNNKLSQMFYFGRTNFIESKCLTLIKVIFEDCQQNVRPCLATVSML